jgi:nucleotide-binding universal stress UspA family protein
MKRILVATDDSPAGLEAVKRAVELARQYGATVRAVHVVADSDVTSALVDSGEPRLAERRSDAVQALFRHVRSLADQVGVPVETAAMYGEPATLILDQARSWPADLVVIGRRDHHDVGGPWVGRETRMVLEFAEQPVLVVPRARPGTPTGP